LRHFVPIPPLADAHSVADLIRAIGTFVWPIVVLVIVLIFRAELGGLFKRIRRVKAAGGEVELDQALDELESSTAAASRAVPARPPEEPVSAGEERDVAVRVLDEARESPKLALISLAAEVERRSTEVVASTGQISPGRRPSLGYSLSRLELSPSVQSAARQFRDVRNKLVHHGDASEDELLRAIDLGLTLLDAINRIPHEVHYVREPRVELFADAEGQRRIGDYHGVLLESVAPEGNTTVRALPTTRTDFEKGKAVSWEFGERGFSEAWYRDPAANEIVYAWTRAAEFVGRPLDAL
jgi:hypothetical protein